MKTIAEIRAAFSKVWRSATHQSYEGSLMSIPVDRERDADCIVHDAIDELARLRGATHLEEIALLNDKIAALEEENKTFCKFNKLFKQDCEEAREEGVRRFLEWSWDVDDLPTRTKDKRDDVNKMLQLWRERSETLGVKTHELLIDQAEERVAQEMAACCKRLHKAYPGGYTIEEAMQLWREGRGRQ